MNSKLNKLTTIPKPFGAEPFVVSSEIFIRIAYPVSRDFAVPIGDIKPLEKHTSDSVKAFLDPPKENRVFERDWLYAICESGISEGYQVTYHDRDLKSHPLSKVGLVPMNVYELVDSSWVVDMQANLSAWVTRFSQPIPILKHFIFAFNYQVFECAATHFDVEYVFGTVWEMSTYVGGSLKWWQ